MNTHSIKKIIIVLSVLPIILACALPGLPTSVANPTTDPGLVQTIVVATAGAAQTQTALVLPPPADTSTATLPPTLTPTETLTATATVIFLIPTMTNTPTATRPPTETSEPGSETGGESCELVAQSPANGTVYDSRERFTTEWTLRNTGSDTWQSDSIDFFHSDGRDMHETDILDLPNNVRPDRNVTFEIDMRAPGNAGTYTSTWTLGSRNNEICVVSVRIRVE